MDIEFHDALELKQRVMPALRLRKKELKKQNIQLTEEEIWNYFVQHSFKNAYQLSLSKIVDEILNSEISIPSSKYSR